MRNTEPSLLVGDSLQMTEVRHRIERIGAAPIAVLIVGETGTGKEVCAEAIGRRSGRSPFRPVNCAAISEHLIESELFGHSRGAFTGAVRDHDGVIARVNGGVLFLDELAEIPMSVQAKLLRTLESGEYQPVGAQDLRRSDFRIVAAVNEDPDGLVAAGRLRKDLLYRLGAIRLRLPPLRERTSDIPMLANEFARRFRAHDSHGALSISAAAMALLAAQPWPGNVRQLRNVVEAAVTLAADDPMVGPEHVSEVLALPAADPVTPAVFPSLGEALRRAADQAIRAALNITDGNREAAARLLRISPATLYRKLISDRSVHATVSQE